MNRQRGFINFRPAFYAMFVFGLIAGAFIFLVLPWLWRALKPWIHQVTG